MAPPLAESRRWMTQGTTVFLTAVESLDDAAYNSPTGLPGWTRRHLVAHVAANAEAIGNLVQWAATGDETPMYASPDERAAGIALGAERQPRDLTAWVGESAERLDAGMAALTDEQWATTVRTARGRSVPATETPWMRAREVWVHAVDLGTGLAFTDLPTDFLEALVADITSKRGEVPAVDAPLPQVAAWLAGRPHAIPDAPALGSWL
jgi:maleylpyruvate isomerase